MAMPATPRQPCPSPIALACLLLSLLTAPGCRQQPDPTSAPAAGAGSASATAGTAAAPAWATSLGRRIAAIDTDMPGELGVLVRALDDGSEVAHQADRPWYLSSTIKVPLAIAVLQQVQAGRLSLDERVVLSEDDFVDGAGDLLWHPAGTRHSIAELIERSIRDSDSVATDMLLRKLGEDGFNRIVASWGIAGFGPITTILQVRYDAYGHLHPKVATLDNMDLVKLRNADPGAPRLAALVRTLGVEPGELSAPDIETAFERYYASGRNSATLPAFATLLERLVRGQLLDQAHTALLLGHMQAIGTGDRRIAAGLPPGTPFAQKTGTQLDRACNVGIVHPTDVERALVVVACAERFGELARAEQAFRALGAAIADTAPAPAPAAGDRD